MLDHVSTQLNHDLAHPAARAALPRHELAALVALRIEKRGEIAVVDPGAGGGGHHGLGAVGDAEAGGLDHAEVVGAVADHQGVDGVDIERLAQFKQRREFRFAPDDRLGNKAGEFVASTTRYWRGSPGTRSCRQPGW